MVDLASRLAGHATATALLERGDRVTYAESVSYTHLTLPTKRIV